MYTISSHPRDLRDGDGAGDQVAALFIGFKAGSHLHNLLLRKCTVELEMASDVYKVIQ